VAINISISVNSKTFLRDPKETQLGKKIIKCGIDRLAETGFQCFNFKQLAKDMVSTEASVYRYFENKHMLLVYLSSWYWDYLDYLIMINTRNISDPHEKLKIAISTIVNGSRAKSPVDYIDQNKLHQVIVQHFFNENPGIKTKNSVFGNLDKFHWDLLSRKHYNHHFRQFGLV